jgi:hypothetical protein
MPYFTNIDGMVGHSGRLQDSDRSDRFQEGRKQSGMAIKNVIATARAAIDAEII